LPEATPPAFAMMLISASMPSSIYVKLRFCRPPSTSWIGSPREIWPRNCVTTRELPSFAVPRESRPGPIQLNGRNSVNSRPALSPYAQMTRSMSCFEQA
jgi:hypothetical protein